MTADRAVRLGAIGAILEERMPNVLDAAIALLETMAPHSAAAGRPRYEIGDKIGEGGQAEVLLGAVRGAEGFHRLIAIKRVRSDLADATTATASLLEEAHLAAPLSHPNVVSVLDLERDEAGQPFLVMEYVDGVSLDRLIATGPVPPAVAIFIVDELLSGLGYIHEFRGRGGVCGLVHRDVSPQNVLLSWQGEVKLADLGVAQLLDGPMVAAARGLVGKAGYMSPEQARREALDGRSDLYAVGIVLWELLAHQPLQVGPTGDPLARASFQAIPRPSQHRPGVPADLEAVALRLLAHDPAARYPTADLAALSLVHCRDSPRDGRGELARLLAERFSRPRRRRPSARLSLPGDSRTGPLTVDAVALPAAAPQGPVSALAPSRSVSGQGAGTSARAWPRRRWRLALGVLCALLLASVLARLALR